MRSALKEIFPTSIMGVMGAVCLGTKTIYHCLYRVIHQVQREWGRVKGNRQIGQPPLWHEVGPEGNIPPQCFIS